MAWGDMLYKKVQLSWAIQTSAGLPLIGRYWTFPSDKVFRDTTELVLHPRLFETRREARDSIRSMKAQKFVSFPKARVIRVVIVVEEQRGGAQ